MSTNHEPESVPDAVQSRILTLLDDLPPESLVLVEQFTRFLYEQVQRGEPVRISNDQTKHASFRYPTVPVPPSSLDSWLNLSLEGYDGDALEDSEALYDEA